MTSLRPDLSGDWVLNREACMLSAGASAVKGERTARSGSGLEPAADGSAHWDGDGLVFTDVMGEPPAVVTMTWRYELVDDGRRLRAVERMRGGRHQDNLWEFDRVRP